MSHTPPLSIQDLHTILPTDGGILLGRTDDWLDAYYTPQKNRLKNLTGFSGSAGFVYADATEGATLLVDSRYTAQAKAEQSFCTVLEIPRDTTLSDFLKRTGQTTLYIDANTLSVACVQRLTATLPDITLKALPTALLKRIYGTETPVKATPITYPPAFAGESTLSKKKKVSAALQAAGLDAFLVTDATAVSWLKNQRSRLNPEFPVVFERGIFEASGRYTKLCGPTLPNFKKMRVGFDATQTPQTLYTALASKMTLVPCPNPINALKAIKNPIQQKNLRQACLTESVVVCRLLATIEKRKDKLSEYDIGGLLQKYRAENPLYFADSFDTIAAIDAHAALPHYLSSKLSSIRTAFGTLLLVDTGAHYLNGTTDMTRTICLNTPTPLMIKRYTQVLQGHIALALTPLKIGDTAKQLDLNAHAPLRADGVDYFHATGHGIGVMLGVHEAPPTIYEKDETPLTAGLVFSNEPAFYDVQNGFGIRLENMLLTQAAPKKTTQTADKNNLILENLLFIPFDPRLVDFDMLSDIEKNWLKSYHSEVKTRIFPYLTPAQRHLLTPLITPFISF